jgi:hypothetical protein
MVLKTQESKTTMDEEGARQVAEAVFQALTQLTDRFDANSSEMKVFNGRIKRSSDDFARDMVNLGRSVKRGEAGYKEQQQLLKQLNDAIEESIESHGDATERKRLLEQKEEVARQAYQQNFKEQAQEFGKGVGEATRTASTQIVTSAGQFVKGLQAGSSGTELSAGLMNTAIDVASAGAGALAKGITGAGAAIAAIPTPWTAAIGTLVSGVGAVANAAQEAAAKLAKFGVEVAAKEVEKTVKAFNSMSASGAMFADGMTGMRASAHAAGLTVEQFSQVVKGSSAQLASSGMSVAEAAQYTGKVLAAGGGKMQQSLLKLGYGFEEQGALVAEVMQAMRGSAAGPLKATEAQVAEQTQKYAENLRVIAAITGEDAKKRQDEARQASANIAFQAELAKMGPEQRAGIQSAMENMTDQQRKNFVDMMVFGTIINKTGAIMAAQMPSVAEFAQDQVRDARAGVLDGRRTLENQKKHAEQNQRELLALGATIGKAGLAGVGGAAGELSEAMGRELPQIGKFTAEGITAAEDAAAKQKETTDGLTNSVMTAEKAAQDLKVALEITLTPAIENFAAISVKMLQGVQDMMNELGFGSTPETKAMATTAYQNTREKEKTVNAEENVGILGQLFGIGLSDEAKRARDERIQAQRRLEKQDKDFKYQEYAVGGIADGPTTGFPAMLHGTEAVVPLPDGKTIPVNINAQDRGEKHLSGSVPIADQISASIKNSISDSAAIVRQMTSGIENAVPDGKSIPVQLAMSMEKELLPGLKEFSGLNIGPMRTDLRIVAAMAEKLGAFTQAGGGTITDTKTWKELLGYGTTYDLGDEKVNALGSFQDTRNLKMEDFSKQIQDLVEQFKQDRAAGQTVTPEQAASNIVDSNKEMMDLMQRQLGAMQEQTNLTRSMINEQQRGTRVSRDILTASY